MSFTQGNYSVREDEGVLNVCVRRSGDSDSHVVVLIATHPSKGTATGKHYVHNVKDDRAAACLLSMLYSILHVCVVTCCMWHSSLM